MNLSRYFNPIHKILRRNPICIAMLSGEPERKDGGINIVIFIIVANTSYPSLFPNREFSKRLNAKREFSLIINHIIPKYSKSETDFGSAPLQSKIF